MRKENLNDDQGYYKEQDLTKVVSKGIGCIWVAFVAKSKVGTIGVVVLVYDPVPIYESFEAQSELLDVFINFVEFGSIVGELEFVGIDGESGRSEGGKGEGLHL